MPLKPRVCVRLPGGGITHRMRPVERFYNRDYREFGIDHVIVRDILESVRILSNQFSMVIVPSGAGAFLLSDLARRLRLSSTELSGINISLVRTQAEILHKWLDRHITNHCRLAESPQDITAILANSDACVVFPSANYESTDALWAASAYESSAIAAFNFKRLTPSAHVVQDALAGPVELNMRWLTENAAMWANSGGSPILDIQAINYLAQLGCEAWILQPEHPEDMKRILSDRKPIGISRRISIRSLSEQRLVLDESRDKISAHWASAPVHGR